MTSSFLLSIQRWLTLASFAAIVLQVVDSRPFKVQTSKGLNALSKRASNSKTIGPLTYDQTTFTINGENVIINSAEFHPWRLPVPELWRDPLQKLKAAGVNTISIYTHWGLIMPSPDASSVSLDAPANQLATFLQIAKEVGVFVILRPGPYINAETYNGGMPGWNSILATTVQTNTTVWRDAWEPYLSAIVKAAVPFQVKADSNGQLDTSGGTLLAVQVTNEFDNAAPEAAYFDELIDYYHQNGITVPTTFNALQGQNNYADDDNLDIWGQDQYPQGFDCANPTSWNSIGNYTFLEQTRSTNPGSIPEFQGGSYDAWGGSSYDNCAQLTNASFVRVFDKGLYGDGVKFKSDYMGFGGTNWGNLAYGALVYTSYDYGAGVNESRVIRDKLREANLIGSFINSFDAFPGAAVQEQGNNLGISGQSDDIAVSHLTNGNQAFYFVRQNDASSSDIATFTLSVEDGSGNQFNIPSFGKMTLNGRDAIFVPVGVPLPSSGLTLNYSTSDVSFMGSIGQTDVVLFHGTAGTEYEFALAGGLTDATASDSSVKINTVSDQIVVQWTPVSNSAFTIQGKSSNGTSVLIRLVDIDYAHTLGFPTTSSLSSLEGILGKGDRVVVQGAYHVANATVNGNTLALVGQLDGTSSNDLDIIAPSSVTEVTFNGAKPSSTTISNGSIQATFGGASNDALSYEPPAFSSSWKYQDSLPEIQTDFKPDSNWQSANLTNTTNAWFAQATTKNVLFAGEYGFYSGGMTIWQGRFNSSVSADQVNVNYIGGNYFASSTFLNGHFIGSTSVSTGSQTSSATFTLTDDMFVSGDDENVFTILIDDTGMQENGGNGNSVDGYEYPQQDTKQPRGIFTFDLLKGGNDQNVDLDWIVTGNQGGNQPLDKTRGPLNVGGLYGERMGWYLPGFDDSNWSTVDPTSSEGGLTGPGVRFYRNTITLDVPSGYDLPLSFVYDGPTYDDSQSWRSLLFINGWQFGKRWIQFGPQTYFQVPPGILNLNGENTVVLSIWQPDNGTATLPNVSIQKTGVYMGEVDWSLNNPTYQDIYTS